MPVKSKPKLVKNTKIIRLPREGKSVEHAFRRAAHYAKQEGWDKVIIIGEGKDRARVVSSISDIYTAIGLLQVEIAHYTKDILDR